MGAGVLLPTRRELSLLLFALAAFLVAYNLNSTPSLSLTLSTSSSVVGIPETALSAQALLRAHNPTLRKDGRRASKFVDDLEKDILGTWDIETRKAHDLAPYGVTEDTQHFWWESGDIPHSKLVAHVPGYTVIDNVYMRDGTLFIVTDNVASFPASEAILSSEAGSGPSAKEIRFVNRRQAVEIIGYSAHRMSGATILCLDAPTLIDNHTFIALHRAYAALAPSPLPSSSNSAPSHHQNPPSQTFFTALPALLLPTTGYPISLARAAFPMNAHLFADDWSDLSRAGRPVLLERALLADRVAAEAVEASFDFASAVVAPVRKAREDGEAGQGRNGKEKEDEETMVRTVIEATDKRLSFAPAFALPAYQGWAEPIVAGAELIARSLKLPSLPSTSLSSQQGQKQKSGWGWASSGDARRKKAVTYVSTQGKGPRLREGDHQALVRELRRLGESMGWEVYVVELGEAKEHELVGAVGASSILLGTHGPALAYTYLLTTPPSSSSANAPKPGEEKSVAIEFFPDGRFSNEHAFVARAIGVGYTCWRNTKKYTAPADLPPISPPTAADARTLAVDVAGVVAFVREVMRR